jgi:hypothetical protein
MKTQIRLLIAALTIISAQAQIYPPNVVGYVNRAFGAGDSLFANPLDAPPNTLSTIFAGVPNLTMVSLWNPATLTFDTTSTFKTGTGWSQNFTLEPGTGALLNTLQLFTNTFVGDVLSHNGGPYADPLTPAPIYSGPNGIFLLGDKSPVASTGNDIFLNILGRAPHVGEQVMTLTTTSTYLGGGSWDLLPTLDVSGAVFLNVGPVPEPSVAALGLLGIALLRKFRRKP